AIPRFGHLPYVMGEGNKKLSKRDPESSLFHHRDRGFVPEGLINYLALLGWSLSADRDVFTIEEMVAAFDVADVNPNPARFDLKKAESINGDHIRMLDVDDFANRMLPYLDGLVTTDADRALLHRAAPLVQERMQLLGEAPGLLAFLFTADDALEFDADALPGDGGPEVLAVATRALKDLDDWTPAGIEAALRGALVDELGLKPRLAFGPLRTAISGRRISPPLFESMELLGKESTLARISRLAERL
ncbi:MAG TPA: glutamate--tRNA ligase family protein, partial [Terrimesophilobacter sp.]|nr:glutamate--tRNA ligase family protein [Terrimesophilobacter sp.]